MESGLIAASADALTACLLLLLYLPVAAFAWRMLIPDLPGPARLLVSGYLLAQVAVILLSFIKQPALSYDWWLWNLDREYNIPATLASMQLAMVAFVALLGAWRHSPRWQRLFFFGLALLFAFLAADEFYLLHEDDETGFALVYAALGMAVAVLTLIMAARAATRREKLWHGTFLAGLALSAFGAFGIDKALFTCDQWLIFRLDHCLYLVPLEEACEFLGIWLALLGLLGMALGMSRAGGSAMSRTVARFLLGWSFLWLLLLCLWSLAPGLELRLMTEPANVRFGSGTELHGYRVERRKHELFAHLIVSARQADYPWLGYTVVLVDQVTGAELARRDRFSRGQLLWHLGADWRHVFRETIPVLLPAETPENRAYWIVLTQWREREGLYTTQSVEVQRSAPPDGDANHHRRISATGDREQRDPRPVGEIQQWLRACPSRPARERQSRRQTGHHLPLASRGGRRG